MNHKSSQNDYATSCSDYATGLCTPLLNRESGNLPDDGFFHLVARGEHPIVVPAGKIRKRIIQVIDQQALSAMLANFNRRREEDPNHRLLIDYEHFSHNQSKSTEAAGWITDLEIRSNGLWGKIDWSDKGEDAVKNKRYRSISPVWFQHQTQHLGGNRFRPLDIADAGLTNKNNLNGLVPFWNRSPKETNNQKQQDTAMLARLAKLLGLKSDATEDQVVDKVTALKNRARSTDQIQGKYDTLQEEHTALKNRLNGLIKENVERILDQNKALITEESKELWKNRLTEDFETTSALLHGLKQPEQKKSLHNPGHARKPDLDLDHNEENVTFTNRVREVAQEKGISEEDAMIAVAESDPDLYREYQKTLRLA